MAMASAKIGKPRPGLASPSVTAGPSLDVLDVGCGTGIAARQFQAAEAFTAVFRRVAPDSPLNRRREGGAQSTGNALEIYQAMFAQAADGIRRADGFGDPEQWRFDWEQSYTRDEWLDHLPTTGALTRLPPEKLTEVLEGAGAAIDKIEGRFTMPYTTLAVTAARTGAA